MSASEFFKNWLKSLGQLTGLGEFWGKGCPNS